MWYTWDSYLKENCWMSFLLYTEKSMPWEDEFSFGETLFCELCWCDKNNPEITVAYHNKSTVHSYHSPVQLGQASSILYAIWSGTHGIQDFYGKGNESWRVTWDIFSELGFNTASFTFIYTLLSGNVMFFNMTWDCYGRWEM